MRTYKYEGGQMYKLKAFWMYTNLGIAPWAWLRVVQVVGNSITVDVMNGMEATQQQVTFPLEKFESPFGWRANYTIRCPNKEAAERVVTNWFSRGIHVWVCHDLSQAGDMAYTPVSTEEHPKCLSPHWKYPGNPCETVAPEDCPKVFTVVWEEEMRVSTMKAGLPTDKTQARKEWAAKRIEMARQGWQFPKGSQVAVREHVIHAAKE